MVIARSSARRTLGWFHQSPRTARNTPSTHAWRSAQRRSYASEGSHSSHNAGILSGDLPWALGATIVTVPSLYYLMQPQLERLNRPKGHGRGGHEGHSEDDKHSKEPKGGEEGDPSEREEPVDETGEGQGGEAEQESQEGGKDEGKSEDSDTSDDESSGNVAHETGSGQDVEGVQFKGAASGGGDTRKHIPDAKGFNKKRIESDYANKQGEANKPEQDPNNEDLAATSKPAGDMTAMSGKQEGFSNTDTKHSTDITHDTPHATKAEGGPESAKYKGTVSPNKPLSS